MSLLGVFNFFVFYLRKTDKIFPVLDDFFIRKCLKAKDKLNLKSSNHLAKASFRFWHFLFLLLTSTDRGFNSLVDAGQPLGIKFPLKRTKKHQVVAELYLQEYYLIHQQKKQKAFYQSFVGSFFVFVISIGSGLFVSLLLPFIFSTSAATYTFIQTDWSGGADTNATSSHSNDRTGWNKFYSKDEYIYAGTSLSLVQQMTTSTDDSDSDFSTGTFDSTQTNGSGSSADLSLATQFLPTDWSTKLKSHLSSPTITQPLDVFVSGIYAYVADAASGLRVVNISDPTNPTIVGTYNSPGAAYGVIVIGSTAYVADGGSGLAIVDITNPASPSLIGAYTTGFYNAYKVAISGSYAYVADGDNGLKIIDISNPASPSLVGTYNTPGRAYDVVVSGSYAYVADNNGGLQIIDISSSTNPTLTKAVTTSLNKARGVYLSGSYAYVADDDNGLKVVNITVLASASVVGIYNTPNQSFGVMLSGNYAYVADNTAGLQIIDVSSSTAPTLASNANINYGGEAQRVFVSGNYAYVAERNSGFTIYDISSTPYVPVSQTGVYNSSGNARGVYVSGDYAYVADDGSGLQIVDISNSASPSLVGTLGSIGNGYGVYASGTYAYLAAYGSGLQIINVSNPASPVVAGNYDTTGNSWAVDVNGNYAYVADNTAGLQIIDVSNVASPSLTATYVHTAGKAVYDVKISGSYAYIAYNDLGLVIIDISNPASPAYKGIYNTSGAARGISIVGNYAYVADSASGLQIIDISSSTNPILIGTFNTFGSSARVDISGNYAYVADTNGGLQIIDVEDPANPRLVNSYFSVTNIEDVKVVGNNVYLASVATGLEILNVSGYVSSGTFESSIIDTTFNKEFTNIYFDSAVPGSTSLSVKARSSANSDMSGATDWVSCNALTSNHDPSSNNCITDGERYLQYYLSFASSDPDVSPVVESVAVAYSSYPTSQTLVSSPFNTEDVSVILGDLSWTEDLPTGTNVKFQLRTASSSDGVWTDWLGPTGTSTYYSSADGDNEINSLHNDRSDDQWIQYKVYLTSAGDETPTLSDFNLVYVVNAAPEFENDPTVSQRESDGLVGIAYSVKDRDTASTGVACPNCVVPSFEYSIDGGANWNPITAGLSAGATSSLTVASSTYTTSTVTWNAKEQIDGTYSEEFRVRVTISDLEGANSTATGISEIFTLDVKDPTLGDPSIIVDASQSPAVLTLNASDDTLSGLQMCISLDNSLTNCKDYATSDTIDGLSSPDTVYVKFRDKFGNVSSDNAVTPEKPINMIIRDVSNLDTSEYQEFIVWKAVSLPFHDYKIYYSTDGENYSLLPLIEDRAINYYFHKNLSVGATYYYKVATADGDGNVSAFSSVISDEPNGQGGTDTTPPTISNVATSTVSTQSVVITWDTDELSKSYVDYSTSPLDLNTTVGSVSMVDNATGIGAHQVVLSGLSPGTHYYFRVRSTDIGDIEAIDDNDGGNYDFTTLSGPAISDVAVSQVSNSGATIVWTTNDTADSYVYYSTSSDLTNSSYSGSATAVTNHEVVVTGLSAGTTYYYYVKSGVGVANNAGDYYSFITTNDGVPPVISNITESIITDVAVLINWSTNELSDSAVYFGTSTGSYSSSSADTAQTTNHAVALFGLTTSTEYFYIVVSVDASGNISTSTTEYDFTTLETLSEESIVITREELARLEGAAEAAECPVCPTCGGGGGSSNDTTKPIITDVSAIKETEGKIKVTWKTNENSNSFVEYSVDESFNLIAGQFDAVSNHTVSINNLQSGSIYNYRVVSQDQYGNLSRSDNKTFALDSGLNEISSLAQTIGGDSNQLLMSVVNKAGEIISQLALNVSIGALEDALSAQYNLIRQLSNAIPAPLLSGEPKVLVTANTATITWRTDKESNSLVAISPADSYDSTKKDDAYLQVIGKSNELTQLHIITISDLEPETIYYYQVRSRTQLGSDSRSENFSFKTLRKELEINTYAVENISTERAIFRWVTNIETDSQVKYVPYRGGKLAVEEMKTVKSKAFSTIHEITVSDFESGVVYEIELSGKDPAGQIISKKIETFSTGQDDLPPVIYQVQTDSALSVGKESNVQTIISWLTNELSTGKVYYQKGVGPVDEQAWEETALDSNYTKKHIAVITKFESGMIYRFKIVSADSGGNEATSNVFTVLTPKQKESVFQVIMNNAEDIFGWTKQLGI